MGQKKSKNSGIPNEHFFQKPWFWMLLVLIGLIVASVFAFNTFRHQKATITANNAARSSLANKDEKQQLNDNAKYFGELSVQDLQAQPQKYLQQQGNENATLYIWRIDSSTTLVRVDTNDGQVTIYQYDSDPEKMMKNQLFQTSK
ncbi:hypothetical protein [Convivina praedatoris]|uniref:Uncharacterized protein n=1 Tax=Convivina praedatoris TaxID=2880963 RepID=A0ABN8H9P8_9LACO|nr:hypothetical protein [Convivina sp. LMG 32447]CAH1850205.1 hypothetical protein R077815_00085 [Convivina sp. LMG 32447]CAH1850212.1 hypothetical protein LMG032447_00087 [Convivina sp. LMG 32447]CAH1850998.1 hypothetical protein R078138_00245 [Convivina sp. LMG 32447]